MRFVALALLLASIPLLIAMLRQSPRLRPWALAAVGLLLFLGDTVRVTALVYGWPYWAGIAKGIVLSPIDTISIALIVTRRSTPGPTPFWGVFAIYGATVLMSLIVSQNPMATLFYVSRLASVLLLFGALAGEFHRADSRKGLLSGVALGLILQAGMVVYQKGTGAVQATGFMYHQNILGMMAELGLMLLLTALLTGERRKLVIAGVLAAGFIVAGGGSRGAMALAAGGAAVLILLSLIRDVTPAKMKVLGIAMLGLAVATPVAIVTLKDRFGNASILTQEDQRSKFEKAARMIAADHPLGVGANNYVSVANASGYAERAGAAWNFNNRSAPVHNAYLLARSETGWLGELAFILMLVWPAMRGFHFAFANRRGLAGDLALGSAVAISMVVIHNNFEFQVFSSNVLGLLMVHSAVIVGQIRGMKLAGLVQKPPAMSNTRPQTVQA